MFKLELTLQNLVLKEYDLSDGAKLSIGRYSENDIVLKNMSVSRHHAIIHREQRRTWVSDLGSANGTTVDGMAVTTAAPLRPGARLTMGPATFMFRLVEP